MFKKAKKRRHAGSGCDCIKQANETLAEYNTRIDEAVVINFETGKCRYIPYLSTSKVDKKNRKPLKKVACRFCPVCGKKYP